MAQGKWTSHQTANIPANDGEYEARQQRQLVETWGKTTQEFRSASTSKDSDRLEILWCWRHEKIYHNRASLQIPRFAHQAYPEAALSSSYSYPVGVRLVYLAPLSEGYRSNRSKWFKFYILSCRLDGEMSHCLESNSHAGIDPNLLHLRTHQHFASHLSYRGTPWKWRIWVKSWWLKKVLCFPRLY